MGLFSSKTSYTVNVTVQDVFEESQIPAAVKSGVIKSILGEGDMLSYILQELSDSIGVQANTGWSWANNNDYAAGIPAELTVSNVSAKTAVLDAIAANEGGSITNQYYYMGPYNSLHYGWQYLVNNYGYNPDTNELTTLSSQVGFKCYLFDMVATYTQDNYNFIVATYDSGVLAQYGPSPTSGYTPSRPYNTITGTGQYAAQSVYEVSATAVDDYLTFTYEYEDASGNYIQRGLTLAITGIDTTGDYHQVRYTVNSTGKTKLFTYLNGSGTYPIVDNIFRLQDTAIGTYFPWAYFRYNGTNVDANVNYPELYTDCSKWLTYLGVDFDTVMEGITADSDLDDVKQVILQLGVPAQSTNDDCIEYLFKHFSILYQNSLAQAELVDNLAEKFNAFTTSPSQIQRISDKYFAQSLKYSGITLQRLPGKVTTKGFYTYEYGYVTQTDQVFTAVTTTGTETANTLVQQPAFIYRYQVLDASYDELAVYGLSLNYELDSHASYAAGYNDDALLVPVDHAILKTMGVGKREQVVCRAMKLLVNTVIKSKTEWYASAGFKWVLIIIAVVITVFSGGTAWQTLVAAASAGATALALSVLTMVLQFVVVSVAVKLFVKVAGPEAGILLAIAAIAYGAYSGYGAAASSTQAVWGERLIQVGTGLSKAAQEAMTDEYNDIVQDITDFNTWAQDQLDALSDQAESLGLSNQTYLTGDDVVAMSPDTVFGETPTDFYSRTVHSGNIGAYTYDLVSNFVDYGLQLPTFDDTEEMFENGDAS